jgi:hypothetical protein
MAARIGIVGHAPANAAGWSRVGGRSAAQLGERVGAQKVALVV